MSDVEAADGSACLSESHNRIDGHEPTRYPDQVADRGGCRC
ncbi:MAG: hypothetical protein QOD87_1853 [Pseudonocardiales bacterium]|nr:hypothetical protein [Pseudonocardiales bacterium]